MDPIENKDVVIAEYQRMGESELTRSLKFLKNRMKMVYNEENEYLQGLILASHRDIGAKVNCYDMSDLRIFELVTERAKYVYEDVLEYFDPNFHTNLVSLSREYGGIY